MAGGKLTDIVNGLLLRDGSVLMARRSPTKRDYAGMWSFPGGHVEKGETFEAALRRELMEEIGVSPTSHSLVTKLYAGSREAENQVTFHLYTVETWVGEPVNLGEEHSELRWIGFEDAFELPNLALGDAYNTVFAALIDRY